MIYLKLFMSFFQIGLFSIGGGYAALPLIKEQIVDINSWLTITEFTDLVTIAEMTPGPIAINASSFVGNQIAGALGSIVATFGCVLPSLIVVLLLAKLYFRYKKLKAVTAILEGIRPAVVALIGSAGISILTLAFWGDKDTKNIIDINIVAVALFSMGLFILRRWKPNPIYIILGSGFIGMIVYMIT